MANRSSSAWLVLITLAIGVHSLPAQFAAHPASSVSTDVGEFIATANVQNLITGITTSTRSTTEFPYETTSQFASAGIGYIAQYGSSTGIITFNFPNPVGISRVYMWNAYFTIEPDHSIQDVEMRFYSASNTLLATLNHDWPICNLNVDTGDSLDLAGSISNVSKVEFQVLTLHGGNDISVRRIAFAGPAISTGEWLAEEMLIAPPFPNPASDHTTMMVKDAQLVELVDATGRTVPVQVSRSLERIDLSWMGLADGLYQARITTGRGVISVPVMVAR